MDSSVRWNDAGVSAGRTDGPKPISRHKPPLIRSTRPGTGEARPRSPPQRHSAARLPRSRNGISGERMDKRTLSGCIAALVGLMLFTLIGYVFGAKLQHVQATPWGQLPLLDVIGVFVSMVAGGALAHFRQRTHDVRHGRVSGCNSRRPTQ